MAARLLLLAQLACWAAMGASASASQAAPSQALHPVGLSQQQPEHEGMGTGMGMRSAQAIRRLLGQPLKIHIYDLPWFNLTTCHYSFTCQFLNRLRRSSYHTSNPEEADYWWIPSPGHFKSQAELLDTYAYVRSHWPYWNRTAALNQTRHLVLFQYDQGPASAAYDRPIVFPNPQVPDDVNPANPDRRIAFVVFNGLRDIPDKSANNSKHLECIGCFIAGKDILLPKSPGICGPLCGYDLKTLRGASMWAMNSALRQPEFTRKRAYKLFYGGKIFDTTVKDTTGRGWLYHYYENNTQYRFARKFKDQEPNVNFAVAMPEAEWCFSPLGQKGGPSDRYSAGMMFGCLPVMLASSGYFNSPNSLPLEEVIDWSEFGTMINMQHMDALDAQLECLAPKIPEMRQKLGAIFRFFLYTSIFGSYVGEKESTDAFQAIMAVLKSRTLSSYGVSPQVYHRIVTDRYSYFPCMQRKP